MKKNAIYILIFIFIINPLLGMLSIVFLKTVINKRGKVLDLFLFLFMAAYASFLQSTRTWNISLPSDWHTGYLELFLKVENTSFFSYVFMQKEPVWNLINYIGYYLNNGSAFLFLNEIAIITIFLTSLSIFIYWKSTEADPITLIASLALIIFFTEYYSQLNNLLRQYFALSIVVYAYVRKVSLNKSGVWLLIIASFIHTLSFVFLLFYMIKPLYEKISAKGILKMSVVVLIIILLLNNIGFLQNMFSKIQFLNNGFNRLMTSGNPQDKNLLDPMNTYINASFIVLITIVINRTKAISKNLVFFTNITTVTMLLSMVLATIAPEIMGRLYISRFYLFPFFLPYFLMHKKIFHNLYIYSIVLFFFIRFMLHFDSIRGGGFFPSLSELLTYSIFDFIL